LNASQCRFKKGLPVEPHSSGKLRLIPDIEGQALASLLRQSIDPMAQPRATCVLAVTSGMNVP